MTDTRPTPAGLDATGDAGPDRAPDACATGATPARAALLGRIGLVAGVFAGASVLLLDLLLGSRPLRGRPLREATISEYVFTQGGWLFVTAVVVLAIGSAALIGGLVAAGRLRALSPASVMFGLWVVGLAGIIAFEKHNWAYGPSASGNLHRVASLLAFLSLPIAVLLVTRRRGRGASGAAAAARWLTLGACAALAFLLGAVVYAGITDQAWWRMIPLGLVERVIAGLEVAALVAVGRWLTAVRQ